MKLGNKLVDKQLLEGGKSCERRIPVVRRTFKLRTKPRSIGNPEPPKSRRAISLPILDLEVQ